MPKYIEKENPYVNGGIERFEVVRETKLYYVVRYGHRNFGYYKKHPTDEDGSFIRRRGADRWEHSARLRIVED